MEIKSLFSPKENPREEISPKKTAEKILAGQSQRIAIIKDNKVLIVSGAIIERVKFGSPEKKLAIEKAFSKALKNADDAISIPEAQFTRN